MAEPKVNQKLRVKTENGATDIIGVKTIEVTNGTLSNPEGGVAKITTGGGGGGGSGDVEGPSSATANNFASFDGTTGKLIKDSSSAASSFATAAQGATADTALANAATAQGAADDAQGAADNAQATADSALTTADLALPKLTTYRTAVAGGNIDIGDSGGVILADSAGGGFNLQLTAATDGFQCVVINIGGNPVTIDSGVGDGNINGIGTVTITNPYDAATIIFAGGTAYAIGV